MNEVRYLQLRDHKCELYKGQEWALTLRVPLLTISNPHRRHRYRGPGGSHSEHVRIQSEVQVRYVVAARSFCGIHGDVVRRACALRQRAKMISRTELLDLSRRVHIFRTGLLYQVSLHVTLLNATRLICMQPLCLSIQSDMNQGIGMMDRVDTILRTKSL